MYPENSYKQQAGAGLPIAIFIITVLSLIVLSMSQLQESSGKAISLQIQSQRAFFAAESGAQARVQQILAELEGGGAASCPADIASFGTGGGLASCSVEFVDCPSPGAIFTLVSIGRCGGGPDRAERTIEVRLK